jgi:hypothetical protein
MNGSGQSGGSKPRDKHRPQPLEQRKPKGESKPFVVVIMQLSLTIV